MPKEKSIPGDNGMLLLALLAGRDMYGYEMIKALWETSNRVFELKAGSLYPLLHGLEAQGYVTAYVTEAKNRIRRYYSITPAGRVGLEEKTQQWNTYADAVRGVLAGGA